MHYEFDAAGFRQARKSKRWSARALAKEAGLAEGSIRAWELGRSEPMLSSLQKAAQVLEMDAMAFFRRVEEVAL